MNSNLLPVAKEAWNYIAYSFLASIVFFVIGLESLAILSLVLIAFFIYVFRNPERELPVFEQNSVLSPVDGEVISIEELSDAEFMYKVSIKTKHMDVGILRAPISATVSTCLKSNGAKLSLDSPLAKKINENATLTFEDASNNKVKITHLSNQSFCGVKLNNIDKKQFTQTARYGVMVYGTTYLYLPKNFRLNIKVSENVFASKSLIGYFS